METLFQLSRIYFTVRAALARIVESPFIRFAALVLLTFVAWRLFSTPPTTNAVADTTAPTALEQPPSVEVADAAGAATPLQGAPQAEAPAPTPRIADGPFDTDLVAWWVVSAAAPGASGKVDALQHLHRAGKSFTGLDLSCRRMNALPAPDVNCQNGAFLEDVDLSPIDGRPVDLSGVDFSGARIDGALMPNAILKGATLARASLAQADLTEAELSGADLTGAEMPGAKLEAATLTDAQLEGAALDSVVLIGADMVRSKLVQADLVGADLTGANLSGADLTGARLADAKLGAALFNLTTLTGVEVSNADFTEARDLDTVFADDMWAWADQPPKNLPENLPDSFKIALCAPGEDDTARRAYNNAVKTGAIVRGRPPNC